MNRKFLLAVFAIGSIVFYLSACSKTSEDKLAPNKPCDTLNVSYSTQVVEILQNNCYECHKDGGVSISNVDLGSYTKFKAYVDLGYVRSAITHDGRVTPMPYGRAQLPSCELNTIVAWINQGAKNN
ncbi:MAG: hypothetical protein JST68_32070 [Bacteroidetes bacterium]|nr:hypothetical protein [Bacteroidota bacterium]